MYAFLPLFYFAAVHPVAPMSCSDGLNNLLRNEKNLITRVNKQRRRRQQQRENHRRGTDYSMQARRFRSGNVLFGAGKIKTYNIANIKTNHNYTVTTISQPIRSGKVAFNLIPNIRTDIIHKVIAAVIPDFIISHTGPQLKFELHLGTPSICKLFRIEGSWFI